VLLRRLGLVQALQRAVVTLVEPPVVIRRHILRGLVVPHDDLSGPLGSNEVARVDDVNSNL
ncbi:uncharacterized protein METZ01_LOCUS155837, partial [marine metagenome]